MIDVAVRRQCRYNVGRYNRISEFLDLEALTIDKTGIFNTVHFYCLCVAILRLNFIFAFRVRKQSSKASKKSKRHNWRWRVHWTETGFALG